MSSKIVKNINENMKLKAYPATIGLTAQYSVDYLEAAAFFTRKMHGIERDSENKPVGEVPVKEHRHYFFSCVHMAFASVEANLNEIIFEQHKKIESKKLFESISFVEKTGQLFFELTGKEKIKLEEESTFKAIKILNNLRNSFTHFRPVKNLGTGGEWKLEFPDDEKFRSQKTKHQKLVRKLEGMTFELNPWYRGNPFYPNEIISHGCAEWAVKTAFNFISFFRIEVGVGIENFTGDFSTR